MNINIARVAKEEASKFFHGDIMGVKSNLHPIAKLFPESPTWKLENWNNCWCSAFVYYCLIKAGISLPVRFPDERVSCNFAGCIAFEEWAKLDYNNFWIDKNDKNFLIEIGDIVLFDYIFINKEHDHIGIVIDVKDKEIVTAEGNFNNLSAIITRPIDNHIRGIVRIPSNYMGE